MEKDYARKHVVGDLQSMKGTIGYMLESDTYQRDKTFRLMVDNLNTAYKALDTHVFSCLEGKGR